MNALSIFIPACSVCFGDPNSNLTKGAVAGVLLLLGVIGFVLVWIGIVIVAWSRRAKKWKVHEADELDYAFSKRAG